MSEPDAKWLEWQRDHAAALAALQEAQRAYHRVFVERALASSRQSALGIRQSIAVDQEATDSSAASDRPAADVQQKLKAVDAARVRLDAVRARKPE
jgi:hypothetical protein